MTYAYELTLANGLRVLNTQKHLFSEQEMLDAFKKHDVVKVKFLKKVPPGYHLCCCGNLAKGTKDELCDECKMTYGHTYESEL